MTGPIHISANLEADAATIRWKLIAEDVTGYAIYMKHVDMRKMYQIASRAEDMLYDMFVQEMRDDRRQAGGAGFLLLETREQKLREDALIGISQFCMDVRRAQSPAKNPAQREKHAAHARNAYARFFTEIVAGNSTMPYFENTLQATLSMHCPLPRRPGHRPTRLARLLAPR